VIDKAFLPIGEATFGGGVATLAGDTSALKTAWKKSQRENPVGAVGSRGDAVNDGDALAQFRLKAVDRGSIRSVRTLARMYCRLFRRPWPARMSTE